MSDSYDFDDNDDILLRAFSSIPSDKTSTEKHINSSNEENSPFKKPRLSGTGSTISQFTNICNESSPLESNCVLNTTKRIFPGPAGILSDDNLTDVCSQDTSSFFQDGPWKEMSKDFNISNSLFLFDKFNIAWIKKEATANKFANQKAPFLACMLFSMEVSEGKKQKTINVTLKDMTGTIQGTILQNLYEEYASHFTLGSVLVFIQFGVLSCSCYKCDNHHITITTKNLSAIYSGKEKIIIKQVNPKEIDEEFSRRDKELKEQEAIRINSQKQNNLNVPFIQNIDRSSCTKSTNKNVPFQSPCGSRNILSPNIVNKSKSNSENSLVTANGINKDFIPSKISNIESGIEELPRELPKDSTNENNSSSIVPKKLFTFKKVNKPPDLTSTSSSYLNKQSVDGAINSQKKLMNMVQCLKNVSSGTVKNQLFAEIDKEEHEKICKDILEDVDVNSFFDDDF